MAIAKSASIVIIFFALAHYADAAVRNRTTVGHDIFGDSNHARDVLLPGEKLVNVESFGAKGDGVTDCTQAFMSAWQATCHASGQNRLYIPAGRFLVSSMYFAGPCLAPNPITIQVVGTVLATTDPSEYENGEWLMFDHINGLKIVGGGVFDGQGQQSWEHTENCELSNSECKRNPSPSLVRIADIHFANVRGTTATPIAVDMRCSAQFPCMGVSVRDIDLKFGTVPSTARCVNVKPVYGGLLNPPACP
ncbi:hypothetical protein RYX36_027196 [Vicia faba]